MMTTKTPKTIAAALLLALTIASCGGSGDSTASLTKAEFIKQADAICEAADGAQVVALGRVEKENPGNMENVAVQKKILATAGLPPVQQEAEEIADLGAPSGGEDEVAAIVDGIEKAIEEAENDPTALESSFVAVDKLAARYGLKACSEAL